MCNLETRSTLRCTIHNASITRTQIPVTFGERPPEIVRDLVALRIRSGFCCKAEFLGTGITLSILNIYRLLYFRDALDDSHKSCSDLTSDVSVGSDFEFLPCFLVGTDIFLSLYLKETPNLNICSNRNDARTTLVALSTASPKL